MVDTSTMAIFVFRDGSWSQCFVWQWQYLQGRRRGRVVVDHVVDEAGTHRPIFWSDKFWNHIEPGLRTDWTEFSRFKEDSFKVVILESVAHRFQRERRGSDPSFIVEIVECKRRVSSGIEMRISSVIWRDEDGVQCGFFRDSRRGACETSVDRRQTLVLLKTETLESRKDIGERTSCAFLWRAVYTETTIESVLYIFTEMTRD